MFILAFPSWESTVESEVTCEYVYVMLCYGVTGIALFVNHLHIPALEAGYLHRILNVCQQLLCTSKRHLHPLRRWPLHTDMFEDPGSTVGCVSRCLDGGNMACCAIGLEIHVEIEETCYGQYLPARSI